jgi:hypothetical protein
MLIKKKPIVSEEWIDESLSNNTIMSFGKFLIKKRPVFLKRYKLYLKEKLVSESMLNLIEFLGIKIINSIEGVKEQFLVICDKNHQKFIKRMKSEGIDCYSQDLIYDGINTSSNLNLEK